MPMSSRSGSRRVGAGRGERAIGRVDEGGIEEWSPVVTRREGEGSGELELLWCRYGFNTRSALYHVCGALWYHICGALSDRVKRVRGAREERRTKNECVRNVKEGR